MNHSLLVVLVAFCAAAAWTVALESRTGDALPASLYLIGPEVHSRRYYADTSRNWSWAGAFEYCRSFPYMGLASFNTIAQMDLIKQSYDPTFFSGDFWTAGRDARGPRQFVWNATGKTLDSGAVNFQAAVEYQTCLFVRSIPGNNSHVRGQSCKMAMAVLCEERLEEIPLPTDATF